MDDQQAADSQTQRRERWLAKGLETLLAQQSQRPQVFDVLIVGSGYGGAVAAERLCQHNHDLGKNWQIAMLERGREYLPGAFPTTEAELPGHLRFTTPHGKHAHGQMEGLFDVRVGHDVSVVLANGVGGGSLINAGVMALPQAEVWNDPAWPASRRDAAAFDRQARKMRDQLQAQPLKASTLRRMRSMQALGGQPVAITVAGEDTPRTSSGVKLEPCVNCGDCATGCNHGAKISLDVGLLKGARDQGLQIYCGATVSRLRWLPSPGLWEVEVWHTDADLRRRMATSVWLQARRVVLAAGTLGSTEILMRSQSAEVQFSQQLGRRFSANGDVLAAVHDSRRLQRGMANEEQDPKQRHVGPTITSMVDWRQNQSRPDMVVQDLGVPGALARFFGEGVTTSALLHSLDHPDKETHRSNDRRADPCAVDNARMQRSLALAMIVRDDAAGVMSPAPDNPELPCDAGLRIDWPDARNDPRISNAHEELEKELHQQAQVGGRLLPNPIWRMLPKRVAEMLGVAAGPLLTVHPLGGCAMADHPEAGVVDACGRVFNASPMTDGVALCTGLVVLDGSIVPTSLGINPSLTIATLAGMAMDELLKDPTSGWADAARPSPNPPADPPARLPDIRPRYALPAAPVRRAETQVQVLERLSGQVDLQIGDQRVDGVWMEIDIVYEQRALFPRRSSGSRERFSLRGHILPILVDEELSRVRVFPFNPRKQRGNPPLPNDGALFVAPLAAGSALHFLHRSPSDAQERKCQALLAWVQNRGARDTWQALADAFRTTFCGQPRTEGPLDPLGRFRQAQALATRAGELRLFDYKLVLQPPTTADGAFKALADHAGLVIKGQKRLRYERRSNPFTQLSRLHVHEGEAGDPLRFGARRSLDLCPAYLAAKGVPLLRVVSQHDQPTAMLDVLSFALFIARVLINVHLWSFRKPDTATRRTPQRLPGNLPGLPQAVIQQWQPDGAASGQVRLTHYPHPPARAKGRVVLMIHGYSASGTTFAHPTVNPNLARALHQKGYEPWILDLRTSCGMPTADMPWTFEDIALVDIPDAIREVCGRTRAEKIHLVTHCMGSAMLSLLLQSDHPAADISAQRLRSWTMSQFGPRLIFSPANTLRAYVVSWVRHAIKDLRFELRPGGDVPGVSANLFDRFVGALPYLNDELGKEFDRENPSPWTFWRTTPWVGTRHRLDALIGRTFDSRQMSDETLAAIDDFFGPISLATITQPIYFAQFRRVTGHLGGESTGMDAAVRVAKLPMLSLHGQTNGLADPETALELRAWAKRYFLNLTVRDDFVDCGHQDSLIGKDCTPIFDAITGFLDQQGPP